MAISSTPLNTASNSEILEPLREHLVPGFFARIELAGNDSLNFYDENDNLTFELTMNQIAKAYRASTSYIQRTFENLIFADIASCKHGAILTAQHKSWEFCLAIAFAKTNSGATAIMIGGDSGTSSPKSATTTFQRAAWGDAQLTTEQRTIFTPSYGFQTQLVPFVTDATFGATSFTPNAFYMPMYRNSDVQQTAADQFVANGATYLCFNAWAIKDE